MENSGYIHCIQKELSKPGIEKEIVGDGNCFFRAISFSLTNSEDYHHAMRNAVCTHLIQNTELFKPFLRDNEMSVESHLCSSKMSLQGSWATEVEIIAMAHLLNIDIYTYTNAQWIRFSCEDVDSSTQRQEGGIYLNHCGQNHYNVVQTITEENVNASNNEDKDNSSSQNDQLKQSKTKSYRKSGKLIAAEKRKQSSRKRYRTDDIYRKEKLKQAFYKYKEDEEFRGFVTVTSKDRYKTDSVYRDKTKARTRDAYTQDTETKQKMKQASIDKYAMNPEHKANVKLRSIRNYAQNEKHREDVKKRSIRKYAVNEQHRVNVKSRSIHRYAVDQQHREDVKMKSVQRYALDEKHREDVKRRSKVKYETDETHKNLVNESSKKRYRENEDFREAKLGSATKRYKTDTTFRSKLKAYNKTQYHSSQALREMKKDKVRQTRNANQAILENEDEVVKRFKQNAKQGIDYSCCCCDRLLFQNQVQTCDRKSYLKSMNAANVADLCIQEKYCHECTASCPVNCTKYRLWICFTCHRKILSGKIPAEAGANNMALEDIPEELLGLNCLEKHLIALHIPFMRIMALPHGGQKNIHGPVVCVPSDLRKVTNLPMKQGEDLLLRVKLKRKLNYKGYTEYQFVNPRHIHEALNFLKQNNHWYENVAINDNWIEINDQEISEENETLQEDYELEPVASDTAS